MGETKFIFAAVTVAVLVWFWGATLVIAGGIILLLIDIYRNLYAEQETYWQAFKHYTSFKIMGLLGYVMRKKLDKQTADVAATQEAFLLEQLKRNSQTEYGQAHRFANIHSVEEFRASHPLTRYSYYKDYVNRMMEGQMGILTVEKPEVFAVTSGTSGTSHILPMVKCQTTRFMLYGISIVFDAMQHAFPETRLIKKHLKLFYTPNWRSCPAGIPVGPNSSSPTRTKGMLYMYTTPEAAYGITSEPEALYVYLLFALKDRTLGMIEANFSSIIFNAFTSLEHHWSQLISDIELGRLNQDLDIPDKIRDQLNSLLTPDLKRATELHLAYSGGRVGLVRRLWPLCHMLVGTDTGSFDLYGHQLRESYGAGIPLYSPIYGATEGLLGINIWPNQLPSRYLIVPSAQFFEFIPVDKTEDESPRTLLLHQVEVGGEYEMVITNLSCMYRYRFGDVVRVSGFYNKCPVIEFLYRQGQFLNVRGEKTSEALFYETLLESVSRWQDVQLMDYCCAESVLVDDGNFEGQPRYHVYIELEGPLDRVKNISDEKIQQIDLKLREKSYVFESFRKKGSIAAPVVHIVQPGSFQKLRQYIIQKSNASSNQYKVPRVLRRKEYVDFIAALSI